MIEKKLGDHSLPVIEEGVIIDCSEWKNACDTFMLHFQANSYRARGVKHVGAFFPKLPFLGKEGSPEFEIFCLQLNQIKLGSIQTIGSLPTTWKENVKRIFTVSNKTFVNTILEKGDFILEDSREDLFLKNILIVVDRYNKKDILLTTSKLLRSKPRTLSLACLGFNSLEEERNALEYFDRVFIPYSDKHSVDGIEKICFYGEDDYADNT